MLADDDLLFYKESDYYYIYDYDIPKQVKN